MIAQKFARNFHQLPQTWIDSQGERFCCVLERTEDVVLVEVKNDYGVHIGYEVAIIRVVPSAMRADTWTPMREAYPFNQDWGQLAWSYGPNCLAAARERIDRIFQSRQWPKPEHLEPQIQTRTDGTRVRILPAILADNDDVYRQVKRAHEVAIFKPDRLSTHEVIVIQVGPPHPLDKHKDDYDLVERYPSTELWGSAAWSWLSPPLAEARFRFILKYGPHEDFRRSPEFQSRTQG